MRNFNDSRKKYDFNKLPRANNRNSETNHTSLTCLDLGTLFFFVHRTFLDMYFLFWSLAVPIGT